MNSEKMINEYLKLSDIMYQALKAKKYEIFENALKDRQAVIDLMNSESESFDDISSEVKLEYKKMIQEADRNIELAMRSYRKSLENELASIHAKKARLRKQANVKSYYQKNIGSQGVFINKLK